MISLFESKDKNFKPTLQCKKFGKRSNKQTKEKKENNQNNEQCSNCKRKNTDK